jgi:hypothetical protein
MQPRQLTPLASNHALVATELEREHENLRHPKRWYFVSAPCECSTASIDDSVIDGDDPLRQEMVRS